MFGNVPQIEAHFIYVPHLRHKLGTKSAPLILSNFSYPSLQYSINPYPIQAYLSSTVIGYPRMEFYSNWSKI